MPPLQLELNKPYETTDATIRVPALLPPGRYRVQLVVENQAHVRSKPDEQIITILRRPQ